MSPELITPILPSGGTKSRTILQPTQPARRAVERSGFRASIADLDRQNLGMIKRLLTVSTDIKDLEKEIQSKQKDLKNCTKVCINQYKKLYEQIQK